MCVVCVCVWLLLVLRVIFLSVFFCMCVCCVMWVVRLLSVCVSLVLYRCFCVCSVFVFASSFSKMVMCSTTKRMFVHVCLCVLRLCACVCVLAFVISCLSYCLCLI